MLFTDIHEHQQSASASPELDSALDPLRARIKDAQLFVFDEQAVAMAANVATTRPSSIIACLQFVRLPAAKVWIEFANGHLRQAMTDLGSPNVRPDTHQFDIERSGFLMWEDHGRIVMDYVRRAKLPNGETLITTSMSRFAFDLDTETNAHGMFAFLGRMVETKGEEPGRWDNSFGASGKVAQHLKRTHDDTAEDIAHRQLDWRFGAQPHPDLSAIREQFQERMPSDRFKLLEYHEVDEAYRMFVDLVLPGLILLNCRNAVERETVPAPDKLNRQRAKKGRPPIEGYQYVKLHLTPKKRRLYESRGIATKSTSGGVVLGHFKLRQSGIYWWNPHWRGPYGGAGGQRVYVMTP